MARPRISLIYTGGTIGMVRGTDGALRPPADASGLLQQLDPAGELEAIADISFHQLMSKDSSNIGPDDWVLIAGETRTHILRGEFDAVIVLHGTDTLAYTAAALSLAFGDSLDRPIILTGAMTAAGEARSDAAANLKTAVEAAVTGAPVVAVAFAGKVFHGARVEKLHASRHDAFGSPGGPLNLKVITRRHDPNVFAGRFSSGVIHIKATPGLKPHVFLDVISEGGANAFLLEGFGAGNLPDEADFSYVEFIRAATEAHVPCVLANPFGSAVKPEYGPAVSAIAAGAIPGPAMTHTALIVKLMWLLGAASRANLFGKARIAFVRERLGLDRAGEILPG